MFASQIGLIILCLATAAAEWNQEARDYILEIHNERRKNEGGCQINKMTYDMELEKQAKQWALGCVFKHEMKKGRGENLAWNSAKSDEKTLIKGSSDNWFNEKNHYNYGQRSCGSSCHYTQMVWDKTDKVGCYTTRCANLQNAYKDAWYFVCFYTPMGNMNGEKPYQKSCSKPCKDGQKEEDGLCVGKATGGGDNGGEKAEKCSDSNAKCGEWAGKGECKKNPKYMMKSCKKSCNQCGGSNTKDGNNQAEKCKDSSSSCPRWAEQGHCKYNPGWMLANCKKSCQKCTSTEKSDDGEEKDNQDCKDSRSSCKAWAKQGYCRNNTWMRNNCKKSCQNCGGCSDERETCGRWAKDNHCKRSKSFMNKYCKKTCDAC